MRKHGYNHDIFMKTGRDLGKHFRVGPKMSPPCGQLHCSSIRPADRQQQHHQGHLVHGLGELQACPEPDGDGPDGEESDFHSDLPSVGEHAGV